MKYEVGKYYIDKYANVILIFIITKVNPYSVTFKTVYSNYKSLIQEGEIINNSLRYLESRELTEEEEMEYL